MFKGKLLLKRSIKVMMSSTNQIIAKINLNKPPIKRIVPNVIIPFFVFFPREDMLLHQDKEQ